MTRTENSSARLFERGNHRRAAGRVAVGIGAEKRRMKQRILILCTGNSARSQMAEALVNARLGESWQAFSAGTQPAAQVNPYALRALAEIGIVTEDELERLKGLKKGEIGAPGVGEPGYFTVNGKIVSANSLVPGVS